MSIYAQFDEDGAQEQVATNTGWSQFGDWVEAQDQDRIPALAQLWEHGHSTTLLPDVQSELADALKGDGLDDDLRAIMQSLHDAVAQNKAQAEIMIITNGMRTDDGSPEESQLAVGETADAD